MMFSNKQYTHGMKQANEIVGQVPEILEIILSHLNAKSLSKAAAVCRLWNEVATSELQKRGHQIIVMPVSNIYDHMETKPQVTLFFTNGCSWRENTSVSDLMKCQNCFPNVSVIVPTQTVMIDEKEIVYTNVRLEQSKNGIVCLLLPQHRNLKIRATYDDNLLPKIGKYTKASIVDALYHTFLDKFLPEDSQSKATFIIFGPGLYPSSRCLKLLQKRMQDRQQEYVIWGADVYTGPMSTMEFSNHQGLFAMSFTGSSLQTWSMVISCSTAKQVVDQKILNFKDEVRLKRHSICLVYGPDYNSIKPSTRHSWYDPIRNTCYKREEITEMLKRIISSNVPIIGMYDIFRGYGLMSEIDDPEQKLVHPDSFSIMILTYD